MRSFQILRKTPNPGTPGGPERDTKLSGADGQPSLCGTRSHKHTVSELAEAMGISGLDGDTTKGLVLTSVWTLEPDFPDRNAGSATYCEMLDKLLNLCVHQ